MSKWHGPYDNPITATVKCMVAEGIDHIEFVSYRLDTLMRFPVTCEDDIRAYLDDLLQEIAGDTNVVVQFRDGQWFAAYDGD